MCVHLLEWMYVCMCGVSVCVHLLVWMCVCVCQCVCDVCACISG